MIPRVTVHNVIKMTKQLKIWDKFQVVEYTVKDMYGQTIVFELFMNSPIDFEELEPEDNRETNHNATSD